MFASYGQHSWYRLMAEVNSVKLPKQPSPFRVIREQIEAGKALKL